ncbi:hypothetical protein LXL04_022429 [Taraxacum kok-saghyz]
MADSSLHRSINGTHPSQKLNFFFPNLTSNTSEMKKSRAVVFLIFCLFFRCVLSGDREALLELKSSMDTSSSLQWRGSDFCKWEGVRECLRGRVSKLVLENLNLTGALDSSIVNQLDQIRVLSLKQNSISGQIPDLSGLTNLKSLYLSHNNFSGEFPASLTTLHRLKIIVLSSNRLSGTIPDSLLDLQRLYVFHVDDNIFTGKIPPFSQTTLTYLNLSNNQLSGEIPMTRTLLRFNSTSFTGNIDLCSNSFSIPCGFAPSPSFTPAYPTATNGTSYHHRWITKIITMITASVGALSLLCVILILLALSLKKDEKSKTAFVDKGLESAEAVGGGGGNSDSSGSSWEGDGGCGMGTLVFCGGGEKPEMNYKLEDLLKASAETLGRGTVGSTYKAVMETGFIVTVKRLKDTRFPKVGEFCRHVEVIGRLRHKNLVPLRAYFQAKEERLLVYDYFPNGSLFSLLHGLDLRTHGVQKRLERDLWCAKGSKTSSSGKPLHWTSCLKIAEDLATGLLHIHQNPGLFHGNIKSTNVLLSSDFESCFTDYGLISFKNPNSTDESNPNYLIHPPPECHDLKTPPSQQSDVYSFGLLLLELLTGKTPSQALISSDHASDVPKWVKTIRDQQTASSDDTVSLGTEKLAALLNVAMDCVNNRLVMKDVLKMIRETRAEAGHVTCNSSSDQSPGRWSDTVQSSPRGNHQSI